MKNDLPSSGVVIKVLYNSIHDADAHPPPLNRVKHYTHVMELCGCSMHKPRVYPHMHWRAPWGRGMTATNTTHPRSGHTHKYASAHSSTHWDMAVRWPSLSPTPHSLGHDCTLALPEPPGSSFQTLNIPKVITRHRSKKATRSNGIMYCCNVAVRLGEAEPAKMAQRSHCSTLCTHNIP